jgi:hypothetical protein
MNPCSIPFGNNPKPAPERASVPTFLGVRNEAVRDSATAQVKIKIQVVGVKGQPNATYEIAYREGVTLKHYLDSLKLRQAAIFSAVRDLSNLEKGRLRLHYVPTAKSHITLGNPSVSSVLQFQRSTVDAQEVAYRMGSKTGEPAALSVQRRLK